MMKRIFFCLLFLIPLLSAFSQKVESLTIGDKLPDLNLDVISGTEIKPVRISQLKAGLILFDFWEVNCSSCIKAMPKLDSLQAIFGDKIKIILVTKNSSVQVKNLFKRIRKPLPSHLLMIENDQALHRLFPYNTVPHHIWIDSNREVRFITDGFYANERNITRFIRHEKFQLPFKNEIEDFDISKPLWLEGGGRLYDHLEFYSYLMSRIKEYGGGVIDFQKDTAAKTIGIKLINQPLIEFYRLAFSKSPVGKYYFNNRIILDVKDSSRLISRSDSLISEQWRNENLKSYELRIPLEMEANVYDLMQEDINRFFPYSAKVERRKVKCLLLVRTGDIQNFKSRGGTPYKKETNGIFKIRNMGIQTSLIPFLSYALSTLPTPLIDETNYFEKLDIEINSKKDLVSLKNELNKYGLDLLVGDRELEMLIIRDK
jgi:thiol-disulfide isomerase/thioredoxin